MVDAFGHERYPAIVKWSETLFPTIAAEEVTPPPPEDEGAPDWWDGEEAAAQEALAMMGTVGRGRVR